MEFALGAVALGALVLYFLVTSSEKKGKAEQRADSAEEGSRRQHRQAEANADELPSIDDMLD